MNILNFDNVSCFISLFIGMSLGLWFGFFLKRKSEEGYIKTIEEYKRKNKKLIFFIRYKLNHITHEEYEEEVEDIEI